MQSARSGTLIPDHTISVTFDPRRSLNRSSGRIPNSVAYSRTSRESRAESHVSARNGFRIRRREIGALSYPPAVSGMLTMRRRRLFGRRMIARCRQVPS